MAKKEEKITLRKELELHHAIALGIGGLIGTGIYISPVGILSHVGSVGASLILWIACGICQFLFALCYAELGCRIPLSGGDYMYLKVVYGDMVACLRLWVQPAFFVLSQGVYNAVFSKYVLKTVYGDCDTSPYVLALLYIVTEWFGLALNYYSVRVAVRMQVFFTGTKLLTLGGVIVLGIIAMTEGSQGQFLMPFDDSNTSPASYVLAFYSGLWALSGWENLCFVTGEMKHPKRDLRVALVTSITVTTGLYVLANVAYSIVLTKEEMLQSPAVAVVFAQKTMGSYSWIMSLCIATAVLGSSIASDLSHSRLLQMGAKQGHLPVVLGFISYKRRTPAVMILFMAALSLFGIFSDSVFYAMELCGFLQMVYMALTFLGLIILRRKESHLSSDIVKAPFAVPEVSLSIVCIMVMLTIYQRPLVSCLMLLSISVGFLLIYLVCIKIKTKPEIYFVISNWITSTTQKLLLCVPEDGSDLASL